MAKGEGLNIIEAHIEKVVLGLCVLLLIIAAVRWIPSSPRRIEVPGGAGSRMVEVSPDEADDQIAQAAEQVVRRNENQTPPGGEVPAELQQYAQNLEALANGWAVPRAWVPITTPVRQLAAVAEGSEMREGPIKVGLDEIRNVTPAPTAPVVRAERELPQTPGELRDVEVARGVAVFPLNKTLQAWQKALEGQLFVPQVDVIEVEVQVQEVKPGEDWAAATARDVEPVMLPVSVSGVGPRGEVNLPIRIPEYDGRNVQQVINALDLVYNLQETILQPPYWPIYGPEGAWLDWRWHLPQDPLAKLGAQEVTSLPMDGRPTRRSPRYSPAAPSPSPMAPGRPGGRGMGRGGTAEDAARMAERQAAELERMMMEGGGYPGMGGPSRVPRGARRATRGRRGTGGAPPTPSPYPGGPYPGGPYPGGMPGTGMPGQPAQDEPEAEPEETTYSVPSFDQQLARGRVLVWFHDQSVRPGRKYRYRIRLKLRNPLLMHERDLAASIREDGLVTALHSPWSEWSRPVQVQSATEFFLAGSAGQALGGDGDTKVRVEVFTRSLGQVVKHTFQVGKGEVIGDTETKELFNPAWESGAEDVIEREVDFNTGAVVVDVDPSKTVMRNGIPRASVEMVFLDDAGRLQTCIVAQHMPPESEVYQRYRELSEEAENASGSMVAVGR